MTTNAPRNAKACIVCHTRLTRTNATVDTSHVNRLCDECYDYAGWENQHSDDAHDSLPADDAERAGCPVCEGREPGKREIKAGHTNTAAHSHTSHDDCYAAGVHEKSAKGRAACRKLTPEARAWAIADAIKLQA